MSTPNVTAPKWVNTAEFFSVTKTLGNKSYELMKCDGFKTPFNVAGSVLAGVAAIVSAVVEPVLKLVYNIFAVVANTIITCVKGQKKLPEEPKPAPTGWEKVKTGAVDMKDATVTFATGNKTGLATGTAVATAGMYLGSGALALMAAPWMGATAGIVGAVGAIGAGATVVGTATQKAYNWATAPVKA